MAFCGKCGSGVTDGVAFCPQCGAPVGVAVPGGAASAPAAISTAGSGLQENVAGLLCYLLGWLTGIVFLMIDKRPFVRFHAAQSIVVFGSLFVLRIILSFGIVGSGFLGTWAFWSLLSVLLSLVTLAAWIILMILAYQGKRYEVPVAAGIAKKLAGQV